MQKEFKKEITFKFKKIQDLRYGENPHQKAAFYKDLTCDELSIVNAKQLFGKELSFNNILDLDSALQVASSFDEPTAVIIKHNNPCGVASSKDLSDAFRDAYFCDSISAFGGIIGLNKKLDKITAEEILNCGFMEALIAPAYSKSALETLKNKKDFRIMELKGNWKRILGYDFFDIKRVSGGVLLQTRDIEKISIKSYKVVTKRMPTKEELLSLDFAWKVVKCVKSNAIILAEGKKTIGIGAGQMSRIDSVLIAVRKAGLVDASKFIRVNRKFPIVLASDAFFPKRDAVDEAAKAGVSAIIQPGGSIRDEESIQACDENDIAMLFTGIRHFKH